MKLREFPKQKSMKSFIQISLILNFYFDIIYMYNITDYTYKTPKPQNPKTPETLFILKLINKIINNTKGSQKYD